METLPIDLINYLAMDMDITDVLNFCKSSKKFNQYICRNKQYWINRLKRDYNVTYNPDYGDSRVLYFDVKEYFGKLGSITGFQRRYKMNDVLNQASHRGNINMMKVAISEGANPNEYEGGEPKEEDYEWIDEVPQPIELAVSSGQIKSLEFLLPLLKHELTNLQKDWLLYLAAGNAGIKMVKYLVDKLKAKITEKIIEEATYMSSEYEGARLVEQQEVINYLKSKY